jgi:myo-inositol-1(or 4)-monophosphatase
LPATEITSDDVQEAERLGGVLREAGAIALKTFRTPIRSWTKGHDSPVTEADMAVDALLREKLSRPDIGWLSEESHDDRSRLEGHALYIADPIDGTRAYLAGLPDWCICAALVEHGRPVVAGVYAPVDDQLFLAASGRGTTRNGEPISVSGGPALEGARIAGPARFLERLSAKVPIVREPKIHSLALRLTRVAEGRIDAAMASVNAHDWDLAAADLLVHEAGGAMTTLAGERLVYNLHDPVHGAVIAAGRARHAEMLDLVRRHHNIFG